jgi:CubicO group peptidase (beta-lactamase class C family)
LLLNGGAHAGKQLIARDWIEKMQQPCAIAPFYGRLVWLNRDGASFPGASKRSFLMVGAGGNYVWIDPELDAVIVLRWLDGAHAAGVMQAISQALR